MIHLAIFHEPYLSRILTGEKTIESRWLRTRAAPYGRVSPGDTLYLKRASGPIVARARAAQVRQYDDLTPDRVAVLLHEHGDALRLEPAFVASVRDRRYAVLIWLADVCILPAPLPYLRRDRRGWVVAPGGLSAAYF